MSARTWSIVISCPRPANRARDDFHVQPHRVQELATSWFGASAEITLTARTARLRIAGTGRPLADLDHWRQAFAQALFCLFLDVKHDGSHYVLPRPVRVELREDDS